MNSPTTKSSLSEAQSRLVELLQNLNFGRIEGLRVRGGQPVFDPPPRVTQKLKLGGENGPRPESSLHDFVLKYQTVELLETISRIGDGQVLAIEAKNGLAFTVEIERIVEAEGMCGTTFEDGFPAALRTSRIRVRGALRARSIPSADRDDCIQELLIACWLASDGFDPARASLRTYFECVIVSRLASAIRTARQRPAMLPLDSIAEFGIPPMASTFEREADVARVLDRLDTADRRVALALMDHSPMEASRELKLARSTVYEYIGRLRTAFSTAGLAPRCGGNRCDRRGGMQS